MSAPTGLSVSSNGSNWVKRFCGDFGLGRCHLSVSSNGSNWVKRPRRYCSVECRNAGNSRAGAHIRAEKMQARVVAGEWRHPHEYMTPEQISETQSKVARRGRLREVAEGRWRNPALSPAAREKLSRPRKHGDNPALHRALEKFRQGAGAAAALTDEEREAHRQYRAQLRAVRREEINAWYRAYYHRSMADPERREKIRARWQRQNRRRSQRSRR